MTTFRTVACFSSSLLTLLTITHGALSHPQPEEDTTQATPESLASLLLPPEGADQISSPIQVIPSEPTDEPLVVSPETVTSPLVVPQIEAEALDSAIAVDAEKLEWARQKLLGRELEETLASGPAVTDAAIASTDDAAETDETAKTTETEPKDETGAIAEASDAAPRWVATSMPLSVTFPDFSLENFLNLPLRLPGNGNISALFPLPIPAPITSLFGWRQHPIFGDWRLHQGIDLSAPMGTPVLAAFSGKVTVADNMGGYGMTVVIQHSDGTQETLYAHLSEILVEPGTWVEQGMAIGRVGSTGSSTGPHLHFEFRQLTDQGWIALDVNAMMQKALESFGELPVAILDTESTGPRSLKNPKKLAEFGQLAGRVVMPERPAQTGSESIFRGV